METPDTLFTHGIVGHGERFRFVERPLVVNVIAFRLSQEVRRRSDVVENQMLLWRDLFPESAVVDGAHTKIRGQRGATIGLVVANNVAGNVVVIHTRITPHVQNIQFVHRRDAHDYVHGGRDLDVVSGNV